MEQRKQQLQGHSDAAPGPEGQLRFHPETGVPRSRDLVLPTIGWQRNWEPGSEGGRLGTFIVRGMSGFEGGRIQGN